MTASAPQALGLTPSFGKSLANLQAAEQKRVKTLVTDLAMGAVGGGERMHPVAGARSPDVVSIRVSRDLRIIGQRTDGRLVVCYVDHHDQAYQWAEGHCLERNRATGEIQLVDYREVEVERHVEKEAAVLGAHSPEYLLQLGVPPRWVELTRSVGDSQFLDLLSRLPEEVAERLLSLAAGEMVAPPVAPAEGVTPGRSIHLVSRQEELRRALDFPLEEWMVFLHPEQRHLVEAATSGPTLVTGAAGTGKTVVALHRAAHLLEGDPGARVLVTSFSRTLAARLEEHLQQLLGGPLDSDRVTVAHVHRHAVDLWRHSGRSFAPARDSEVEEIFATAFDRHPVAGFDAAYLKSEWEALVEPWGLASWEAYAAAPRTGRGRPLGGRQRRAFWDVFAAVREELSGRGLMTWSDVCHGAAGLVEERAEKPFDHVVTDEVQDLGPAELRFLRSLVPPGPDDLFLCGDSGQQIFRRSFSWRRAGIAVAGRARRLVVNYRTTEQIRRFADGLLPATMPDPEGQPVPRHAISLFSGPEPELAGSDKPAGEIQKVAAWIEDLTKSGFRPGDIGIFARTNQLLEKRAKVAVERAGRAWGELREDKPPEPDRVALGTMHRAKGLEFRAVAVMGCDRRYLPLQAALKHEADPGDKDAFIARERQLLYVACTRAQRRLMVSWSGRPSRFLEG